jgi:hypothetical protein
MTDITKIETPLGLLDKETFDALRKHGGPYERYLGDGSWQEYYLSKDEPISLFALNCILRVKSPPPKPREFWVNEYLVGVSRLHSSKETADMYSEADRIGVIRLVEVLE